MIIYLLVVLKGICMPFPNRLFSITCLIIVKIKLFAPNGKSQCVTQADK